MAEKIIFTMGEVAEMFDVNPSLLRHWETLFPTLRPKRNKKGNRLFTRQDIENLRLIYHLVKERGMTLEGAKKALRGRKAAPKLSRDAELAERLQQIRSILLEVREELKAEGNEIIEEPATDVGIETAIEPMVTATNSAEKAIEEETVAKITEVVVEVQESQPTQEVAESVAEPVEEQVAATEAEVVPEPVAEAEERKARRRRRKKEGEDKELFAFYEQSLF